MSDLRLANLDQVQMKNILSINFLNKALKNYFSHMRRTTLFLILSFISVSLVEVASASPDMSTQEEVYDPIEAVNRSIFNFNDKADIYVLEPVAKTYDDVMPDGVQRSVGNFFKNLKFPRYFVADLIQGKWSQMLDHTGRFLINTTVGVGGLFDVATEWGIEENTEDIGLAFAYHGVPAGPYIVLPFLGPSNLRDTVGTVFDFALDPLIIFGYSDVRAGVRDRISYPLGTLKFVDARAGLIEAVDAAKEGSVDYYLFMQSAYYQHRWGELWDGSPPEEDQFLSEAE